MQKKRLTIAATGHRPDKLGGYGDDVFCLLTGFAVSKLHILRPSKVISGMALGWDMAVAQACVQIGIPFIAAIPFNGQESRWPEESKQRYWTLMSAAQRIEVVSSGGYSPWKMQLRNEWMVDHAQLLLALWNGSHGGTGNCVLYANCNNVEIEYCWEDWMNFKSDAL